MCVVWENIEGMRQDNRSGDTVLRLKQGEHSLCSQGDGPERGKERERKKKEFKGGPHSMKQAIEIPQFKIRDFQC